MYAQDILHKTTSTDLEPAIIKQTACTTWVDGNHGDSFAFNCFKPLLQ